MRSRWIEVALALTALVVVSAYGIAEFPILKDMGFFSYIGQEIARGYTPYSTVYELKPPLLFFSYALAMNAFDFLPQYMSIRVFMLVIIAVSVVLFYRVLLEATKERFVSALSALVYLSFNFALELALLGDSKAMAMMFSFLATLLAFRKRHALSGVCAAVALLFWQPFGVFLLVPLTLLVLEGDLWPPKFGRFAAVAIGFAIPLAVLVLYFMYIGSLTDLANFSLLYPLKYEYASFLTRNMWTVLKTFGAYSSEFFYIALGVTGFAYVIYKVAKDAFCGRLIGFFKGNKKLVAFSAAFAALAIVLTNYFEAGSQFAVVLPALSALAVLAMVKITGYIAKTVSVLAKMPYSKVWNAARLSLVVLVCAYGFFPALQPVYPENPIFSERSEFIGKSPYELIAHIQDEYGVVGSALSFLFRRPGEDMTIQQQLELARMIQNSTSPDEKLLSLNAPEILFLANRRNLNQYPLFEGVGFYELAQERGELGKIKSDIVSYRPKFILYTRDSFITKLGLDDFVKANYVKSSFLDYNIYTLRGTTPIV